MPDIVAARRAKREHDQEALQAPFSQHIGPRKVELDWLKKKLAWSPEAKRTWLEPEPLQLSLARQWALLGLPRSTDSDHTQGERAEKLHLMRLLEQQDTEPPSYGVRVGGPPGYAARALPCIPSAWRGCCRRWGARRSISILP